MQRGHGDGARAGTASSGRTWIDRGPRVSIRSRSAAHLGCWPSSDSRAALELGAPGQLRWRAAGGLAGGPSPGRLAGDSWALAAQRRAAHSCGAGLGGAAAAAAAGGSRARGAAAAACVCGRASAATRTSLAVTERERERAAVNAREQRRELEGRACAAPPPSVDAEPYSGTAARISASTL